MSHPYPQPYTSTGSTGIYSPDCTCSSSSSSSTSSTPKYEFHDDFSACHLEMAGAEELRMIADKTWYLAFNNGPATTDFDILQETIPQPANVPSRGNVLLKWTNPVISNYKASYMANFYQCAPIYGRIEYECRARLSHVDDAFIDTRQVFIGLGSVYHPTGKTGHGFKGSCGFAYVKASSPFWRCSISTPAYGDGISSDMETSVVADTSFTTFKIILTASGTTANAEFFINGTAVGSLVLTNSADVQMGPRFLNGYSKTSSPLPDQFGLWVDYVTIKQY